MMREHADLDVRPAPSQDLTLQRAAVVSDPPGGWQARPGLVSPACRTLRTGFQGAYCYRRLRVTGDEKYTDKFSHSHDALQYLLSGAGEGRVLLGKERRRRDAASRPSRENSRYNPIQWRAPAP